jgi:hypothetical protein
LNFAGPTLYGFGGAAGSLVDLSALEAKMDRLVCDCYGLTDEQKELVLFYGK